MSKKRLHNNCSAMHPISPDTLGSSIKTCRSWLGLAWLRAETLNGVQKILPCVYIPGSVLYTIHETSRERPKSAPYPRLKNSKRISNFQVLVNWEHFYEIFFSEKVPQCRKKTEREDPLVSSGIVCYAGNLFGSVPWATRYILAYSVNFVELLVELFWSVQVYFGLKKTLTKSHDYSRLFS